jgi:hypothetical protein
MPDEEAKARRKRPGGALDNLLRNTIHLNEATNPGWLKGYNESRLTHGPAYAISQDQIKQFMDTAGNADAIGMTFDPASYGSNSINRTLLRGKAAIPNLMGGSPYMDQVLQHITKNPSGQPIAIYPTGDQVTARHEIAHQATLPLNNYTMDIPSRAADFLKARGYKPEDYAAEYPAFIASDPTELGMTPEAGRAAMQDFIEKIVAPRDPKLAERWKRQAGLTSPSTTEADRSYSNPNVTF